MRKRYRIQVLVLVSTASIWGAVAQAGEYKAVILNGKPSKLHIKTLNRLIYVMYLFFVHWVLYARNS